MDGSLFLEIYSAPESVLVVLLRTGVARANRQRGRGHVTLIPPPNVFHAHFLTVNDRKSNFQKGIELFSTIVEP
jgi:hypothetical protein